MDRGRAGKQRRPARAGENGANDPPSLEGVHQRLEDIAAAAQPMNHDHRRPATAVDRDHKAGGWHQLLLRTGLISSAMTARPASWRNAANLIHPPFEPIRRIGSILLMGAMKAPSGFSCQDLVSFDFAQVLSQSGTARQLPSREEAPPASPVIYATGSSSSWGSVGRHMPPER